MAGSGGSASGGQPGKPFVPDNITVEYAGAGPTGGLELIAFTLASNGTGGAVFYVAVKNNGTDVICGVDVPADFFDGSGTELASTIGAGALAAPMYNSFGSPSACLGPGDIGMGTASLGLSGLDVSQVAKIEHGFVGNISSSAVKLTGVTVDNVMLEVAFANNYKATGTVTNNSGMVISNPEVTIFAVDSVGRPFGEMSALDLNPISNGGTWMFNSTDTEGPVSDYVAYVSYD